MVIKGSERQCMVVELRMQYFGEILNHLRHMSRSYGTYLFSKSANELLVSVMSHCLHIFSVDLLDFLLKRRHLKKSANKFIKNKEFNVMMENN